MYKKIFFDLLLSCICFIPNKAIRIPLDIDLRTSPFLQSTSSTVQSSVPKIVKAPFTWSHNYLGKLLHQANIVEIGPRGALFILYDNTQEDDTKDLKVECQSTIMITTNNQNQTLCLPSKKGIAKGQTVMKEHVIYMRVDMLSRSDLLCQSLEWYCEIRVIKQMCVTFPISHCSVRLLLNWA
jgi:hypothetical protein